MITFNELLERAKVEKIVVYTPTEKQATILLKALDKKGYEWFSGDRLTIDTLYETYKENTGYTFEPRHKISYCSLVWYQVYGYVIIEFSNIDFQEE